MDEIEKELQRSVDAQRLSQEGKVRVSARRAAGLAITEYQKREGAAWYGNDFIQQLRAFAFDPTIPLHVREAAYRLQSRLSRDFRSISHDPVSDAKLIIEYIRQVLR
ncbi:MAG: hypothetical protein V1799_09855 [bacterium]